MPDATYVGAGMPCGNCGNPLTPGQPHKCGRTPDFDRRLDESWEPSPAASPDERLREALDAAALTAAGQNMANTLERNCPCYCDHPLRAGLPPCSRCSSLAAWRAVTGSSEPRKETT